MGGRPRYYYAMPVVYENNIAQIERSAESMDLSMLTSVLSGNPPDLDASPNRKIAVPSSRLCGYQSEPPFYKKKTKFVSEYVEHLLYSKQGYKLWEKLETLEGSFRGIYFEEIALKRLAAGSEDFNSFQIINGSQQSSSIRFDKRQVSRVNDLIDHLNDDGKLCWSFNNSQPFIDASCSDGIFQMTVASKHPNARSGALAVANKWGATEANPMNLYFVVPKTVFDTWKNKVKAQPFAGDTPNGWPGDDAMHKRITQIVLCIPEPTAINEDDDQGKY